MHRQHLAENLRIQGRNNNFSAGMDSSYESDKHLEIHPGDIDESSRSNGSANSIEDVEQVDDISTLEIPIQPPFKKSVTFASTCSSNLSTEEDLQRREDAARKSREGISSVRVNENNPFNAIGMDVNIPSCRERNGINQPALGDFDDDASSIVSDRSSFMVPVSPISDFTPSSTPLCLSPMQSPPLQAMDRSGAPNHYRIPSAVFAMTSSPPIEWSLASNESLFSLHIGNNSFTKDRVVVVNSDTSKSCEPRKSSEVVTTSEGLPFDDSIANMEKVFQSNKPIDILEDLQKGCENEPSMELSHATTSSYSELPRAPSFSIPVKKRRSGTRFCCHATKCASSSCCCSCCGNCSGKRLWCSILLCGLPEVAKCCKSEKTQKPKASSKSDTDDCFLCSCSSCSSCCSCSSCNSCCTCPSCKSCCCCPSCQHSCSCSSCFSCSSCHSCCSCRSCSFPSCKSCCNCPSCSSCCTFPSCKSCCSCPSCHSCCSCCSCHSCCSCPSCHSCCSFLSCHSCCSFLSCHSCCSCPSAATYSCHCCKSC